MPGRDNARKAGKEVISVCQTKECDCCCGCGCEGGPKGGKKTASKSKPKAGK
jgi:hypothetical protein